MVALLVHRLRFTEAAPIPLHTHDRIVCEIFPHSAHVSLFGLEKTLKYKTRSKRSYEQRWSEMERYQKYLRRLRKAEPPLKRTKNSSPRPMFVHCVAKISKDRRCLGCHYMCIRRQLFMAPWSPTCLCLRQRCGRPHHCPING